MPPQLAKIITVNSSQLHEFVKPDERLKSTLASAGTDAHLLYLSSSGKLMGHCGLWWNSTPLLNGKRTGYIGQYKAHSDDSARELLGTALARLQSENCAIAVGPIDGSTWNNYRFVTGGDSNCQPFFLEPVNRVAAPRQFISAGFDVCARYTSALASDLTQRDPRSQSAMSGFVAEGITLRFFDIHNASHDLRMIYRLSKSAFANNFLYSDITEEEYIDKYLPLCRIIIPELVTMLEQRGQLVGFCFALPNYKQNDGTVPASVILKTLARSPQLPTGGLGRFLIDYTHQIAHNLGFQSVIHALMCEDNTSKRISNHTARTFREYSLFSRTLQ